MRKIYLLIFLTFLMVGCGSRNPEIFLGDSTCALPCWYGLQPDKTNLAESQAILAHLPFVDQQSIKIDTYRQGPDYLFWRFTDEAVGQGRLYFAGNGALQKIDLRPMGLDLGKAIDVFGEPESVLAFSLPPAGDSNFGLTLYSPAKGIVVEVRDKSRRQPNARAESITRDLTVTDIFLFAPTTLESYLEDVDGRTQKDVDYLLPRLQPWPGFGDNVIQIKP